jgi:hypothetical protein
MTDYHNPAWTEESRFRGALDDVFIIPLVYHARRKQNLAFHSFDFDADARLRRPFSNVDCLGSALRGEGTGADHCS